jgi:ABC-type nitrate/sulfonate/bicarbonate transport system permease component
MAGDVSTANRRPRSREVGAAERWLLTSAGFAALFGTWFFLSRSGFVPAKMLPGPDAVARTVLKLVAEPFAGFTLQQHLLSSIGRYLLGFLLAAAVGVPMGLLMGWSRRFDHIVTPVFDALRFIAPIAWVPFATLWFGTGIGGPILIIFSGAFAPCVINAYRGAKLVDTRLVEAARVHGANDWQVITQVLIPGSIPSIVAGLRIGAGVGWQSLVGAELIVVSSGVAYLMVQGQNNLATSVVMSGMVAVGLTGAFIDLLLRTAEARIRRNWAV